MNFYYKQYEIKFFGFIQPVLVQDKKTFSEEEIKYIETFANEYGSDYNNYISNILIKLKTKI